MGDTVNLASRLEGANKAFGTTILLGSKTAEEAGDAVVTLPIGDVQVVGYEAPVPVHALLALAEDATPAVRAQAAAWRRAQAAARAGDLHEAHAALDEAERAAPGHGAHAWFRGVLDEVRAKGAAKGWSGVVVLAGK
jgi:adenylate cyclase